MPRKRSIKLKRSKFLSQMRSIPNLQLFFMSNSEISKNQQKNQGKKGKLPSIGTETDLLNCTFKVHAV